MLENVSFFADNLKRNTYYNVCYPSDVDLKGLKVVYLLHGYCGDCNDWVNNGCEAQAIKHNCILIMPSAENSWYVNHKDGVQYFDLISKEILNHALKKYNIEDNELSVAGLSMGGYGALRVAFCNENVKCVGSFSGVCDLLKRAKVPFDSINKHIFDHLTKEDDLYEIYKQRKNKFDYIMHYCGQKDHLIIQNNEFKSTLEKLSNNYEFHTDDYGHEWDAWKNNLDVFLTKIHSL